MKDAIDTLRQFSRRIYHSYCAYCGVQLAFGHKLKVKPHGPYLSNEVYWNTATFDHWIARANGGTHRHKIPCCFKCNREKGTLGVEEFRIVFFGAHVEKFWIERMADIVRALPSRPMRELTPQIPFCATVGSIDRWEAKKRYAGIKHG